MRSAVNLWMSPTKNATAHCCDDVVLESIVAKLISCVKTTWRIIYKVSYHIVSTMDNKCKCGYGPGCNRMDTIEFVFEGVLSSIVGLIGFLGNVSAILYYRKRRSNVKTRFHGLMMALAAYDLVIIISALLLFSVPKFS